MPDILCVSLNKNQGMWNLFPVIKKKQNAGPAAPTGQEKKYNTRPPLPKQFRRFAGLLLFEVE